MNVRDLQGAVLAADLTLSQVEIWGSPEGKKVLYSRSFENPVPQLIVSELKAIIGYLSKNPPGKSGCNRVSLSDVKPSKIRPANPNISNRDDGMLEEPVSGKNNT